MNDFVTPCSYFTMRGTVIINLHGVICSGAGMAKT